MKDTMLKRLKDSDGTREFDALGFGEVMLRLSSGGKERISQGTSFEKSAGGSELNVVSGISLLGRRSGMMTKLPKSAVGMFINNSIRFCGVSDDYVVFDESPSARLGVYYYETGAYPRKSSVIYDRQNSCFTTIKADDIPSCVFGETRIFHTSGISLALGGNSRENTTELIKKFHDAGALVSFDVNYRANLISEDEARRAILEILPYVDIFFVSEESSRRMFCKSGELRDIMKSYTSEFGISMVATTHRTVISPNRHNFSSTIYSADTDEFYTEPPYMGIEIVDRLGSGDAYVAGVLFALLDGCDYIGALEYGDACSALKNTVLGDLPASDLGEIKRIIAAHKSGAAGSEMNR